MSMLPATPIMHSWSLPMMPTLLDDVLLPGERSRLLLKEPAHLALLKAALEEQGGFFGMLLQQNGRCSTTAPLLEVDAHSAVAPLLMVDREPMHLDRSAIWVDVTCVGRLSVDDMDISHDEPYDRALVSTYVDEPEHPTTGQGMDDWMEILATKEEQGVHEAHTACHTLAAKIKDIRGEDPGASCSASRSGA